MSAEDDAARIAALEDEVRALQETRDALVVRVERDIDTSADAFHLFQTNALLRQRVEERTRALSAANETLRQEIEERKRIEAQLIAARDQAEEANRAKTEFLANMSHELRTPLNGVVGMTSLLLQAELAPVERECAETIQQSADSLQTLINEILDFSRIEAGRMTIVPESFSLIRLTQDALRAVEHDATERGLDVSFDPAPELPEAVFGDAQRLRQVLLNLLTNAVKFTHRGHIRLCVTVAEPERIRFAVEDTGIGISDAQQGRIFEAFTQADASTTRRYGGTGLGLTISQRLVRLMGGDIGVVSRPGAGSTFTFELPLPTAVLDAGDAGELVDAVSGRPRVLVVEDVPINRLVARRQLERLGCVVTEAPDGPTALACLETETFDLVLMDCSMPGMDGFETTDRIRAQDSLRGLPIVALTAHALPLMRERCHACGMDDVLVKPVPLDALRAALTTHVSSAS